MPDHGPLNPQTEESSASEVTGDPPKTKRAIPFVWVWAVLFVLIIGLVGNFAWTAVTNFMSMGMRAKLAEGPSNLNGIRTAEFAYHAQHGEFRSAGTCPLVLPGRQQAAWEGDCADAFWTLGWAADGAVRCQYTAVAIPGENEKADFKLTARCDADGDGAESVFEASRSSPAKRVTPEGIY